MLAYPARKRELSVVLDCLSCIVQPCISVRHNFVKPGMRTLVFCNAGGNTDANRGCAHALGILACVCRHPYESPMSMIMLPSMLQCLIIWTPGSNAFSADMSAVPDTTSPHFNFPKYIPYLLAPERITLDASLSWLVSTPCILSPPELVTWDHPFRWCRHHLVSVLAQIDARQQQVTLSPFLTGHSLSYCQEHAQPIKFGPS